MGDSPTPMGWDSTTLGGGGFMIIRGEAGRPPTKGGGVFTIGSLQSKCHAQCTPLKNPNQTSAHLQSSTSA
jgi:hypothetical protein